MDLLTQELSDIATAATAASSGLCTLVATSESPQDVMIDPPGDNVLEPMASPPDHGNAAVLDLEMAGEGVHPPDTDILQASGSTKLLSFDLDLSTTAKVADKFTSGE